MCDRVVEEETLGEREALAGCVGPEAVGVRVGEWEVVGVREGAGAEGVRPPLLLAVRQALALRVGERVRDRLTVLQGETLSVALGVQMVSVGVRVTEGLPLVVRPGDQMVPVGVGLGVTMVPVIELEVVPEGVGEAWTVITVCVPLTVCVGAGRPVATLRVPELVTLRVMEPHRDTVSERVTEPERERVTESELVTERVIEPDCVRVTEPVRVTLRVRVTVAELELVARAAAPRALSSSPPRPSSAGGRRCSQPLPETPPEAGRPTKSHAAAAAAKGGAA